jgi:hypothetical protein
MKLLNPYNLNLTTLIKDDQFYSYLTNTNGKLGIGFKKGKLLRKLIPAIQYFISVCITEDEAQGDCRTIGFKRIRISDVQHVMSYKKMRQVINFLVNNEITEVKEITERITVKGRQFTIDAKYFKLKAPYDGKTEIIEIPVKTKRAIAINPKAKQLIQINPVIRHQFEMCNNYTFNAELAKAHADDLYDQKIINEKQWVYMLDYIGRLKLKSVIFNYNEKTDRIFTIINLCNKEIRPYFQIPNDTINARLVELDFSTFNIQVLHKIVDDSITISNKSENILNELKKLSQWLEKDFYQQIQKVSADCGVEITRDMAKTLALKHWQNARPDSWNEETNIMKTLFPEITKAMNLLKGDTYEDYRKYSVSFMRIESQLVQEIYSEFISRYPTACIYNIFDSFMVDEQYKDQLNNIMDACSKKYFNRQVKIKEKVTNNLY